MGKEGQSSLYKEIKSDFDLNMNVTSIFILQIYLLPES